MSCLYESRTRTGLQMRYELPKIKLWMKEKRDTRKNIHQEMFFK